MRTVFVIRSLDYGGSERQLVSLARGLRQAGDDVAVAVFYEGGPLEGELEQEQIPVLRLRKRGRWDGAGFFVRALRTVGARRPHVLHGYGPETNLLVQALKAFLPGTKTVWGLRSAEWAASTCFSQMVFHLGCLLSRYADLHLTNSVAGSLYYRKNGYPADKLAVIPNGIDTERFQPDRSSRDRVRQEWGIAKDEVVIGLVGRLEPQKGHQTFLEAAARFARNRTAPRFVCVGDGPALYAKQLRRVARDLGIETRLLWAGPRSYMVAIMNAFDIATSASTTEGCSNTLAEAMACGVRCVATDVGDSARILGGTGIIVPPGNAEALAEGWKRCLALDPNQVAATARARILEKFGLAKMVRSTREALDRIASP